jgi:large subunit ribosomal protein L29
MAATTTSASELRELADDELVLRLREAKEELFNLRFQMATGQMDNNRRLRTVRHDIARIYTVMRERELGLSVSPDSVSASSAATSSEAGSEGAA